MHQKLADVFGELIYTENLLKKKKKPYIQNYITIRLVTVLEQFCRQLIEYKIDQQTSDGASIKRPSTIQIETNDLHKIKEITASNLIATSYNFQNTESITENLKIYNIKNSWPDGNEQIKNQIDELMRNRHNAVHTVSKIQYDVKQGYDAVEALMKHLCKEVFKSKGAFYYYKGVGSLRHEKIDVVNKYVEEALLDYKNINSYSLKAVVLINLGGYDEALEYADKIIDLEPMNGWGYVIRGFIMTELNKYSEAMEWTHKAIGYCDKAIEINPNDSLAHEYKKIALEMLEKSEEAQKNYDKTEVDA